MKSIIAKFKWRLSIVFQNVWWGHDDATNVYNKNYRKKYTDVHNSYKSKLLQIPIYWTNAIYPSFISLTLHTAFFTLYSRHLFIGWCFLQWQGQLKLTNSKRTSFFTAAMNSRLCKIYTSTKQFFDEIITFVGNMLFTDFHFTDLKMFVYIQSIKSKYRTVCRV